MKIHCHTNLDLEPGEIWPEYLSVIPRVGDRIVSGYKSQWGLELALNVVRVEFRLNGSTKEWYVDVELHLPSHWVTIRDFEIWYKKYRGRYSQEEYLAHSQYYHDTEEYKNALSWRHKYPSTDSDTRRILEEILSRLPEKE